MTAEPVVKNPYPGPRPFEEGERNIFFGRNREVKDIFYLITANPAVLLYAQSGAGKTSLLNAGLIPMMKEEDNEFDVLPVARVRVFEPEGMDIDNIYVFNALMSWAREEVHSKSLASMSFADFLNEYPRSKDQRGITLPLVAIFDQFEEIFTFYPERWEERKDFFNQISQALKEDPTLRVLFVIREDYLANLLPYAEHLPDRLNTRYRLERLREPAALSAVESPLEDMGCSFGPGVAASLVQELLKIHVRDASGEIVPVPGEYVEPVQLQIVCQNLWVNLPTDVTVITSGHLQAFGDVEEALRVFYERAIETASAETGIKKDELRGWFSNELITQDGTRGTVFRGDERTGSIPNEAVDTLEDQHIVRAEMRAGGRWYELTHDRLIGPIRKANEAWLAEEQRREAEAERQRADEEQKRADEQTRINRKLRLLVAGVLVMFLLTLFAGAYAIMQAKQAEKQREIAVEERAKAREAEIAERQQRELAQQKAEEAEEQARIAREQRIKAEEAKKAEEEQRKIAQEKEEEAKEQARIAVEQQEKAEEARKGEEEQRKIAQKKEEEAKEQARIAEEQRIEAEEAKTAEEEQRKIAQKQAKEAEEQRQIAVEHQEKAEEARKGEEEQRKIAQKKEEQAGRQSEVAISRRLTAQAMANMERDLELSILLASEAWEIISRKSSIEGIEGIEDAKREAENVLRQAIKQPIIREKEQLTLSSYKQTNEEITSKRNGIQIMAQDNNETIKLLSADSGNELQSFSQVSSFAFGHNGEYFAVGMKDGIVKVWDIRSVQEKMQLRAHMVSVCSIALSPDGKYMATAGLDGTVKFWDISSRQRITTLPGKGQPVLSVAFNSAGSRLIANYQDGNKIILDTTEGTHKGRITQIDEFDGDKLVKIAETRCMREFTDKERQEYSIWAKQRGDDPE